MAVENVPIDLDWENYDKTFPFWHHLVAGSAAGVMEHLAIFPLDTLKTHLQVATPQGRFKIFSVYKNVLKENKNSVFGFMRGWSAIGLGCVPAHMALFSVYETCKDLFKLDELKNSSPYKHFVLSMFCGSLATLSHDLILTPLDLVKQRLQLGCYKGVFDCFSNVLKSEGSFAFLRSFGVTLFMNAPSGAILVGVNESLKNLTIKKENDEREIYKFFACAGAASALASILTQPLDVIKTKLQTQDCLACKIRKNCDKNSKTKIIYKSPVDVFVKILKEDGPRGFYRGLFPRTILSIPGAAICWGTYEIVKKSLKYAAGGN